MGYLANFVVYTLAMVGVIVVALLVFKNATSVNTGKISKNLMVLDTLSLGPRKTLYIVSAGKERFLIAGDTDKTNLISKLDYDGFDTEEFSTVKTSDFGFKNIKDAIDKIPHSGFGIKEQPNKTSKSEFGFGSSKGSNMIKTFAERIK